MDNQEAIERMESVREYLCAGNPIWNVDEMREAFNMAISALQAQDSPKPTAESVQNVQNEDLILRKAAIDALAKHEKSNGHNYTLFVDIVSECAEIIRDLPSAQPEPSEITDEQAILHLQSTGWMQRHDKEMYESGLREQLADDSGSYDGLIPYEDTVSRQAAISELMEWVEKEKNKSWSPFKGLFHWTGIKAMLECLPSAQTEIVRCKDCKYFELDHFEKVEGFPVPIIVAHEICMKWSDGCKTSKDGWCFMGERRTDEGD